MTIGLLCLIVVAAFPLLFIVGLGAIIWFICEGLLGLGKESCKNSKERIDRSSQNDFKAFHQRKRNQKSKARKGKTIYTPTIKCAKCGVMNPINAAKCKNCNSFEFWVDFRK